jgi:hypothetical protein
MTWINRTSHDLSNPLQLWAILAPDFGSTAKLETL